MAKPARKHPTSTVTRTFAFDRADLFVALGLAIATIAIYARVVGHQFISLDDDLVHSGQSDGQPRPYLGGNRLGFHHISRGQLAPP